jgi:hypothetical protein
MESTKRQFHISAIDAWSDFDDFADVDCFNFNPSDPDCACRRSEAHTLDGTPCTCPCGLRWVARR